MSIQRVSVLPRIIVNALEYFSIDPRVWVVLDLYRVRRTWSSRAPLNSLLSNQCHAYRHMYSWLHLQIKASVFIHIWILKSCDLDVWRKPERLFIQWRSGSTPETPILTYRSRSHNRLTLKPSPMKFSSSGNFKATATISNIFFWFNKKEFLPLFLVQRIRKYYLEVWCRFSSFTNEKSFRASRVRNAIGRFLWIEIGRKLVLQYVSEIGPVFGERVNGKK